MPDSCLAVARAITAACGLSAVGWEGSYGGDDLPSDLDLLAIEFGITDVVRAHSGRATHCGGRRRGLAAEDEQEDDR